MELRHVVSARHLGGQEIEVAFDDGAVGMLNLGDYVEMTGVFAPLSDEAEIAKVQVHPETRTLCWPSGADLDPDALYEWVINGRDLRG